MCTGPTVPPTAACSRNDLCHTVSTTGAPGVSPTAHAAYDKGTATSSPTDLLRAGPIPTEGVRLSATTLQPLRPDEATREFSVSLGNKDPSSRGPRKRRDTWRH